MENRGSVQLIYYIDWSGKQLSSIVAYLFIDPRGGLPSAASIISHVCVHGAENGDRKVFKSFAVDSYNMLTELFRSSPELFVIGTE